MPPSVLRHIPSVNELLEAPALKGLVERVSRSAVVAQVRGVLDEVRIELQNSAAERSLPQISDLAERIARRILQGEPPPLRPVINATGNLFSRELGGPPLAETALTELHLAARDYATAALDPSSGRTSQAATAAESLLRELAGAEAALVASSHAGALLLTLSALAAGREVLVARGQMTEVDGSRLPDLIAAAGAAPREVGATRDARLADYRDAIGDRTAAILVAHPSDYRIVGAAESAALADLARLARERRVPLIHDLGWGGLLDLAAYGLPGEPTLPASLAAGADLALASGDKLLGGPACGIVAGRRGYVERLLRHPLAAALSADKLALAALAGTLRLYRDPDTLPRTLPLLTLLATSGDNLKNRAERLAPQMAALSGIAKAEALRQPIEAAVAATGGCRLESWSIALTPAERSLERLAAQLRQASPPVVGRTEGDRLVLDLRTVFPRQDLELVEAAEALGHTVAAP